MTKTVEEVRRAAFEAALHRDWAAHLVVLDRDGDGYVFGDIDSAWWAWQSALDAVEIQLPSERKIRHMPTPDENQSYNEALENCKDAIEQTGLGLKIK